MRGLTDGFAALLLAWALALGLGRRAAAQDAPETPLMEIPEVSTPASTEPPAAAAPSDAAAAPANPVEEVHRLAPPAHRSAQNRNFATYVSLAPDPHAFRAFSDGGWDGTWYVGFNTCWIVRLPAAPPGDWARAFIGARLGRAKTVPHPGGSPWDKDAIAGKVSIAIADSPAFPPSQSFVLADTGDIPYEPDESNPNLNAGQGEWFWTEIPLKLVNFRGDNYLAVWSPTEGFVSSSSAPILGAAIDDEPSREPRAWLNSSIQGVPPREQGGSIGVPVSFYLPSLVIKLVPPNDGSVDIKAFAASPSKNGYSLRFTATGTDVSAAWIEASPDGQGWEKISGVLHQPPYSFTLPSARLGKAYAQSGTVFFRGAAEDDFHNLGLSDPIQLDYKAP